MTTLLAWDISDLLTLASVLAGLWVVLYEAVCDAQRLVDEDR